MQCPLRPGHLDGTDGDSHGPGTLRAALEQGAVFALMKDGAQEKAKVGEGKDHVRRGKEKKSMPRVDRLIIRRKEVSPPRSHLEKDCFLEKRFNGTQRLWCVFQRHGGEKEDLTHSCI